MKEVVLTLLWVIFITDSILLVLIVLLQSGRGGGLSGMLGGAGMGESALGPKTGLPRITGVMAGIFFATAILIGIMTRPRQIIDPRAPREETPAAETTGLPEKKAPAETPAPEPKAETPKAQPAAEPPAADPKAEPAKDAEPAAKDAPDRKSP